MMKDRMYHLIKKCCFANTISGEDDLKNDLGIDSLDMIELIIAIEEEFKFEFEESDLDTSKINTVDDLFLLVEKRVTG